MTVEQQLRKLPKPYDEMAIEETIQRMGERYLESDRDSLALTLSRAFSWGDTDMGADFWYGIYLDAEHHNL